MKSSKKNKILILLFCLLIATITLLLNSKCSPLYPFNGWDDFNTFYTIGENWTKGLIPYKDLFEQKGPFLYIIFAIGYLITPNKFTGIFILEILFLTITLYISNKIIKLFIKNKSNLIILPLYTTLLTTSPAFVEGGSSEEFNLLFTTITIYYILKYLKLSKLSNIKYKELILLGLCCGLSLMIKYTTVGLWFIMMAIICIDLLKEKKYKESITKGLTFILFMLTPFIIFCIYFYINNALYDFLNTYFYINIFKYSEKMNIFVKIYKSITFFLSNIFKNIPTLILTFSLLYYYVLNAILKFKKIKITKKEITFIIISIFTIIILYFGQRYRPYTILAVYFYILLIITNLFFLLKNHQKKLTIISFIIIPILLILNIDYDYMITPKEKTVQYHFAKIMNQYENPTLLHYRAIDEGFYTAANIKPITKYFEQINISYDDYPKIYDAQDEIIKNKQVQFVVFRLFDLNTKKKLTKEEKIEQINFNNNRTITVYLGRNYEIIETYKPTTGYYDTSIYYLYKVKE